MSRCIPAGLLGLASLAGCAAQQPPLQVSEADSGKVVTLQPGQTLEVHLKSQGGTGYQWTRTNESAGILAAEGELEKVRADNAQPGASQDEVWRFRADKPGQEDLTLEYHRPWEVAVPERTFNLQIIIH